MCLHCAQPRISWVQANGKQHLNFLCVYWQTKKIRLHLFKFTTQWPLATEKKLPKTINPQAYKLCYRHFLSVFMLLSIGMKMFTFMLFPTSWFEIENIYFLRNITHSLMQHKHINCQCGLWAPFNVLLIFFVFSFHFYLF